MKKTVKFYIYVLLLMPLIASSQSSDLSNFSGLYECLEVLESPKVSSPPGIPQPNECCVPNKKYESSNGKVYTWLIVYPLKVEITGDQIKILNMLEMYQRVGLIEGQFQDISEGEGKLINNVATIKMNHYKKPIKPLTKLTTNDEVTMTVDLSNKDYLILTSVQVQKLDGVPVTNIFKSKYKKIE